MRLDQIAFYAHSTQHAEEIKLMLGLQHADWIKDTVTAMSSVNDKPAEKNVAELQFNYSLGIELEILRYIEGPNWQLARNPLWMQKSFISHAGFHLDDNEPFPLMDGALLVQETFTQSHTAAYLTTGAAAGRTYHYRIYELTPGSYLKFIKRIHPEAK